MNRCTGHCCKNFTLPGPPAMLEAGSRAHTNRSRRAYWIDESGRRHLQTWIVDGVMINNMAIYLGVDEDGKHRYNCVHLQASGDCGVYDERPWMCREYPYGRGCDYEKCTWTAERSDALAVV